VASLGVRLFAGAALRRLFVGSPKPHFTEDSLALHFLFQRAQGLIDIIIADENLNDD